MKFLTLFLLAGCLQLSAKTDAQVISFSLSNASLGSAFNEIQQQTSYRFIYTSEQMAMALKVSITVQHASLEKVLELCFKDQPLEYSIEEKYIIVRVKEKKAGVDLLAGPIKGKVLNEQSEPIVGASIIVKGSKQGTSTDGNGAFVLTEMPLQSVIIFSSIGYESKQIIFSGESNIVIQLVHAPNTLDETIIKGYYNTTKRLNTGSVSKLTAEDISKQPVGDPIAALEGRVPGLFIQQSSGAPGSAFTIQLRGINSINSGNAPLYIVDGIPFNSGSLTTPGFFPGADVAKSPFNNLNPADIESIEVLKDADATAIYGSRGANGVVLITTKKAVSGKNRIDINFYNGTGKITRMIDMLNTSQYLEMRHEAFTNDNSIPNSNTGRDLLLWDTTRYTDWQKVFIGGTSSITDAQLSLSGGNSNTQFLIGGGFRRETTVYPGHFNDTRGSLHVNLSNSSTDKKMKTDFTASYSSDDNRLPQVDLIRYIALAPDAPALHDSSGKLNWENSTWINPFSYLQQKFKGLTDNLIGNLQISYLIAKGFTLKSNFAFNNIQMTQLVTTPLYSNNPAYLSYYQAEADFGNNRIKTWIIEPQLDYRKIVGKNNINILGGVTLQENRQISTGQIATGFSSDALLEDIQAASSVITVSSLNNLYRYNGFYSRVNYNFDDKYILNLTGRRDGSSRFGLGRQFANFGAVGVGWIFSKALFFHHYLPFISFAKLRGSYGITGNDQIGDYQYLSTYSSFSYQYMGVTGLYPSNLLNPNYGWETNKKIEIAIELGLLQNNINFILDYYRNRSSNQLVGYSLPVITGFSSIVSNQPALVQNTGLEVEFNSINIKNKNFTWRSTFNISVPRNKLVAYPNFTASSFQTRYAIGYPLNILKLYHYLYTDAKSGTYQFEKLVDHSVTTMPQNPDDYIIKDMSVKYYGGLTNSVKYKSLSIDLFIQFVKKPAINYLQQFPPPGFAVNQPTYVLDRWQKEGDNKGIQRFTQTGGPAFDSWNNVTQSDHAITDGSFIRFKNISFSYQLPEKLFKKVKLQSCRIYIQAQNLFTITRYKGFDPENLYSLPPLKVITAGIQLTL